MDLVGLGVVGTTAGVVLLPDALAWLECDRQDAHRGGDHSIFIGAVLACSRGRGRGGLLLFDSEYQAVVDRY